MTRYGVASVSRSSARVAHTPAPDLGGRGGGRNKRNLPKEADRSVNERDAARPAPDQIFTRHALTSALAILDITTLLDAGTARLVSSGRAAAPGGADTSTSAPITLDALLAGMAEPR